MNKVLVILDFLRTDMFDDNMNFNIAKNKIGKELLKIVSSKRYLNLNKDNVDIKFLYNKIPDLDKKGNYKKFKVDYTRECVDNLSKYIVETKPKLVIMYGKLIQDAFKIKKEKGLQYELQKVIYKNGSESYEAYTSFNPSLATKKYQSRNVSDEITLSIENRFLRRFIKNNYNPESLKPQLGKYEHIKDFDRVKEVFEKEIPQHKIVALDFETNTLDVWREGAKAIMVSISWKEHQGITIPISHKDYSLWTNEEYKKIINYINNLVSSKQWIVLHHAMYDIYMLMKIYNLKKATNIVDTEIMYYIAKHEITADESKKTIFRNLKQLAYQYTDMGGYENKRDEYFRELKEKWYRDWFNKETERLAKEAEEKGTKPKAVKKSTYKERRNEIDGSLLNYEWLPLEIIEPYAAADTDVTLQLYNIFLKDIIKNKKWVSLIFNYYPKLVDALCYMQASGVYMDKEALKEYDNVYENYRDSLLDKMRHDVPEIQQFEQERLEKLNKRTALKSIKPIDRTEKQAQFFTDVGKELMGTDSKGIEKYKFTPSSSAKIGYILYEMLGYALPIEKKFIVNGSMSLLKHPEKITWKDFKTNKDALNYVADEFNSSFARSLLEYSGVEKILTSYVRAYPSKIDKDSLIHPHFNPIGTVTGRMSSQEPNYQQIPKPTHDVNSRIYKYPIKGLTKSRFKNGIFLNADYKTLEIYVAALFGKDTGVTTTLMKGADIHRRNASIAFNVSPEEVTAKQRQASKAVSFGTMYGQTEQGLMEKLYVDLEDAQQIQEQILNAMPMIKASIDGVHSFVKKYGYVETIQGNYRRLPLAKVKNEYLSGDAIRQSFNAVVQGSAAYFTGTSIIFLREVFQKLKLKSIVCLTVHDSIGIDVHPDEILTVTRLVKAVMENPHVPWLECNITDFKGMKEEDIPTKYKLGNGKFRFPLNAELEWGKSYADGIEWNEEDFKNLGIEKMYKLGKAKSLLTDSYSAKIESEKDTDKKDALISELDNKIEELNLSYKK